MTGHISGEQISAWVDGELDPSDARRAEAHLRLCAMCRAVYEETASVTKLFRAAENLDAPPYLWQRIHEATVVSSVPANMSWYGSRTKLWAAAATIVIIIGGAIGFYSYRNEYVSRQIALAKLDNAGKALSARFPDNPFRTSSAADWDSNPFSKLKPNEDVNPFRSLARQ